MNRTQEVVDGLVVADGDAAILLKLGKEVFDQVARPVEPAVMVAPAKLFLPT
jgi:hypothetical protein